MENNSTKEKYGIYLIAYTDLRGKRTRAEVAEESNAKAFLYLEEALMNLGYEERNIENMTPLIKNTGKTSYKTYIKFTI